MITQPEDGINQPMEEISTTETSFPEGKYEIIVMDPPWPYGTSYDPVGRKVASPYPEMTLKEIEDVLDPGLVATDCILWLWTTHSFIFDAKCIMDKWGFTYKGILVLNKERMGMGYWFRMQCEFCLLGIKGKPAWGITNMRDIIVETRREHSRKPECFYNMIDGYFPGRKKLDFFSREQRPGWDQYGNETTKFKNHLAFQGKGGIEISWKSQEKQDAISA